MFFSKFLDLQKQASKELMGLPCKKINSSKIDMLFCFWRELLLKIAG
ncbi:hypothetical protein pah_c013o011 [Parachlamydia acanthamoebae str. Hall's coccus]|nr:hypothetical protein pah_c013o011 [Parachlamydia acanthamoebae str. Hall's coccus]